MKAPPTQSLREARVAFSLIEVALATGIVSFCLVALIGLLPVALSSVRHTRDRQASINALETIVTAIRNPTTNATEFRATGAYTNIAWSREGSDQPVFSCTNISSSGMPDASATDQKFCAYVEFQALQSGQGRTARVTLAWPRQATYDPSAATWNNAEGSIATWLILGTKL
jgi:uncharacterized protein (TIGR02598 family)